MKKLLGVFLTACLAVGALSGCGQSGTGADGKTSGDSGGTTPSQAAAKTEVPGGQTGSGSKKLVIYSPSTEDIISAIIPEFEKDTGITVEIITASSGELWKRIESEKDKPIADVMWGGTKSATVNNADLLAEYVSVYNDEIPEAYRNDDGRITYYCLDGSDLIVNDNLIGDIEIKGYADLLKPELKGKIAMGDPSSSSAAYAQLTNMLLAMGGDYESDAGWEYVENLVKNAEGKMGASSSAVHKSVADGEYIVAVSFEAASIGYERDGAEVSPVYMEEGVVFLPGPAGIIKNAPNQENAQKFIDFILSKQAQEILAQQMIARPIRNDIEMGDVWTSIDDMVVLHEDVQYTQEHKQEILDKYKDILTGIE